MRFLPANNGFASAFCFLASMVGFGNGYANICGILISASYGDITIMSALLKRIFLFWLCQSH
ncbi:MAG: hypothetical protein A2827_00825 [Candidatus Spechtbacteria bacterium RIFCSPHIGHO2_01_FULL_43_30]|uniref:Uncharacterized protein n=1 Tax=Candidatus Spechtbacteria bacterium RIFCSPHIGHO2_01_FULL_43_30 TaxID=1802158 RepID=A0A1G2H729_9BACT|nr:MAG: hypothetical protein A2827_00825 [Candidatus Spechtbacteria bacterium RIFCSPHIGHO2_01_FULL_43_30]